MKAIGSQPGDLPSRFPVNHSDQGAYAEGQNASPLGRTCTKIALWCWVTARSSHFSYSALTWASDSPGLAGKSRLRTVVSHMPRSWRGACAGTEPHRPTAPAAGPIAGG